MSNFPWHYFVRSIRARIILIIITAVLTFVISISNEEYIFPKILIVIFFLTIVSIIQGYLKSLPFKKVLEKLHSLQHILPHDKKINLLYQKNELILIKEMLRITEKYIQEQSSEIKTNKIQATTLMESIPGPIVWVDSYLNIVQYNKHFDHLFPNEQQTKIWKTFESMPEILQLFESAKELDQPQTIRGQKIKFNYFDITVTPIYNVDKKRTGFLAVFHNVSEAKLTEKMRVDFVANVSHEIRTPLTAIKGFSQLLTAPDSNCPEEVQAPLKRIIFNSEKLEDLFNNLLKLSVIESQYEIKAEQINSLQLFKSIESTLKGKYKNKAINISYQVEQNIFADKKLIEHALTNLIDNSVKYSQSDTASIEISVLDFSGLTEIKISDFGPGIDPKDLDRIFERFYRVQNNPQANKIDGSGLGLSIVKHIINKHKGKITVESEVGKGTRFTILLPNY